MRVLVFDTETTGLPKSKIINPDTLNLWPYIVQFSYVIYDTDVNDMVVSSDNIVKVVKREVLEKVQKNVKFNVVGLDGGIGAQKIVLRLICVILVSYVKRLSRYMHQTIVSVEYLG